MIHYETFKYKLWCDNYNVIVFFTKGILNCIFVYIQIFFIFQKDIRWRHIILLLSAFAEKPADPLDNLMHLKDNTVTNVLEYQWVT